jgi:hypothetical protein
VVGLYKQVMFSCFSPVMAFALIDTRFTIIFVRRINSRGYPADLIPDIRLLDPTCEIVGDLLAYGVFGGF